MFPLLNNRNDCPPILINQHRKQNLRHKNLYNDTRRNIPHTIKTVRIAHHQNEFNMHHQTREYETGKRVWAGRHVHVNWVSGSENQRFPKFCSVMFLVFPGGAGGVGPGQEGQDVHHCGPPSVHHPKRRPHRCLPGRSGGRTGDTSAAAGHEGSLPHAGHQADGQQQRLRGHREQYHTRCFWCLSFQREWFYTCAFYHQLAASHSDRLDSFSGTVWVWMCFQSKLLLFNSCYCHGPFSKKIFCIVTIEQAWV